MINVTIRIIVQSTTHDLIEGAIAPHSYTGSRRLLRPICLQTGQEQTPDPHPIRPGVFQPTRLKLKGYVQLFKTYNTGQHLVVSGCRIV